MMITNLARLRITKKIIMADTHGCPFCPFRGEQPYAVRLHYEEQHRRDSPFVVRQPQPSSSSRPRSLLPQQSSSSMSHSRSAIASNPTQPRRTRSPIPTNPTRPSPPPPDDDPWTTCPRPECGEVILLADIDDHLSYHYALELADADVQAEPEPEQLAPPALPPRPTSQSGMTRSCPPSPSDDSYLYTTSGDEGGGGSSLTRSVSQRSGNTPDRPRSHHGSSVNNVLRYFAGGASSSSQRSRPSLRNSRRRSQPRPPGRLGKSDLGPYAFEDRMPPDVSHALTHDARPIPIQHLTSSGRLVRDHRIPNETSGVVRVLADLCALDTTTRTTYLCHPVVKQIYKIPCDGNFCGYWNIQVMLTYLRHIDPHLPQLTPDVLQIQDVIEQAWDQGICAYGRVETGGIRNTRKWIGAAEAVAFFTCLDISVITNAFSSPASSSSQSASDDDNDIDELSHKNDRYTSNRRRNEPEPRRPTPGGPSCPAAPASAADQLLDHVEAYFMSDLEHSTRYGTSHVTSLAPIYFQRAGHSMTIVGIERKRDGSRNLLVFDSSFRPSSAIRKLAAGERRVQGRLEKMLEVYRREERGLRKWKDFEIIV